MQPTNLENEVLRRKTQCAIEMQTDGWTFEGLSSRWKRSAAMLHWRQVVWFVLLAVIAIVVVQIAALGRLRGLRDAGERTR